MLKSSLKWRRVVFLFVTKRVLLINFFWWKRFRSSSPWRSLCRDVLLQEDHGTGGERKRREITQWSHRGKQSLKHQISSGTFSASWCFTTNSPNSQTYISRHDMGGPGGGAPSYKAPAPAYASAPVYAPQPPLMPSTCCLQPGPYSSTSLCLSISLCPSPRLCPRPCCLQPGHYSSPSCLHPCPSCLQASSSLPATCSL
jgi:hypothetical protein